MSTCSKRVIIHPGVDLTIATSAAAAFDKEYVATGKGSTGIYHARQYTGIVVDKPMGPKVSVDVHQSETSIIVRLSEPVPEKKVLDEPIAEVIT